MYLALNKLYKLWARGEIVNKNQLHIKIDYFIKNNYIQLNSGL
jgi:hypothetical protein